AAVMRTVGDALMTADGEERLATLDAVVVHTHTGRLDSYKAGAAVTLLRSQGRVSRLDRPGLPLGILEGVQYEHSHDTLSHGDVLLMVSDGALAGGVAAIEELLRDYPADGGMEELASTVCAAARRAEDHGDDITAVALRVTRAADFS
ncbi:MAG: SpoIIE family protein phosphatase, partial [Clostridia bacterium]|nr:SpoIIE family protein phosphatase [Clostridia bacterium]